MENNEIVYLYLDDIIPNRFQPREVFDDQALKELAISIKEHGVIQPIIVRKVENKYEIIAGERRYKASTMAGLTKIPAIVKNLDDQESSKVALIENLQRRDLTPIEEARTYQKILELEPGMTQEQLASTMGKTQSVVSNKLRLLALPDEVQDALLKEKISERHARSLLNLTNKNDQIRMLDKVITNKMTVRELDKEIREMNDRQGQNDTSQVTGGNGLVQQPISFSPPFKEEEKQNSLPTSSNLSPSTGEQMGARENSSMFNPTAVDINKIRESAVDINGPKTPTVDVKDLMRDTSVTDTNNFKFVPSNGMEDHSSNLSSSFSSGDSPSLIGNSFGGFGSNNPLSSNITDNNNNNNNSSFLTSNQNTNDFNSFFSSASSQGEQSNSNLASSKSIPSFNFSAFENPDKKDVSPVINDIKSTIKNIESKGYKVLVEENDSVNTYQITIKVDKNI